MIRVLQVLHGMDCGGAENMIMNLYRRIDRTQVQFDFLVHTEKKCYFDDEIKGLGGNIYHVPYYNIKNHFSYKKALNVFFSNHPEIKIVHGHLGSCAHIYLSVAKKYGCYAIAHSHNTKPVNVSLKNILYRLFTFKTRRVADFFFGCSQAAAEYRFGKKIAHSEKCSVLKNAIEIEKFAYSEKNRQEIRNEFDIGNQLVIGHVGRFNTQKNHTFLIDIFAKIYEKNSDAILMLLGDGNLRPSIEQKVENLGLKNNVIFTGVRKDANKFFSAFDVLLFPSHYEGLPVTLIEAQTAGLPIVCSDVITKEAQILNTIYYHSLSEKSDVWAEFVVKDLNFRRIDFESIENAGYSIECSAKQLTAFYLEACNDNC